MSSYFLFIDLDLPQTHALSRMRSIFSLRDGIYSPLERVRIKYPQGRIYFLHPDRDYESHIAENEGILAYQAQKEKDDISETKRWLESLREKKSKILESRVFRRGRRERAICR